MPLGGLPPHLIHLIVCANEINLISIRQSVYLAQQRTICGGKGSAGNTSHAGGVPGCSVPPQAINVLRRIEEEDLIDICHGTEVTGEGTSCCGKAAPSNSCNVRDMPLEGLPP